jgi:hypothetical protein
MTTENLTDSLIILFEENGFVFVESKYENLFYKAIDVKDNLKTILFAEIYNGKTITMYFKLVIETNKIVRKYGLEQIANNLNKFSRNSMSFEINEEFDHLFAVEKILENLDMISEHISDLKKMQLANTSTLFARRLTKMMEMSYLRGNFVTVV